MNERIIVYGHPACPQLPPVLMALRLSKIPYDYINIHQDAAAAERVRSINGGFESVPTLVFQDGSSLTEPSTGALREKLVSAGYRFNPLAYIAGNFWLVLFGLIILIVILRSLGVL